MDDNPITKLICNKITELGYKSVTARLALVNDVSWKIALGHFICDIVTPQPHKTLLHKENFALEDFSLSIDEFKKFLDYLNHAYTGTVAMKDSKVVITDDLLYTIGNYKLCFVGNFPSRDLYFYGRQIITRHHGIQKPAFVTDYALNESISGQLSYNLDLTDFEVPLRNGIEAINHFWSTHFEQYNISTNRCRIYLPIYDASIAKASLQNTTFKIKFEILDGIRKEDLSLSVIANAEGHEYRKKHDLRDNSIEVDIEFTPSNASFFLNKNGKKLDEYNYYIERPLVVSSIPRSNAIISREISSIRSDEDTSKESEPLFDREFIAKIPLQLQPLFNEIEITFKNDLYRSTALLLRIVLEESLTLAIRRIGKDSELYNDDKFEVGLNKKITLGTNYIPTLRQIKTDMETIKWFGDNAAHEVTMPFRKSDIVTNLEPKMRVFLSKMIEIFS